MGQRGDCTRLWANAELPRALSFLAFAGLAAWLLAAGQPVWAAVSGGPSLLMLTRSIRVPFELCPDEVLLRSLFRTRRIPRREIAGTSAAESGGVPNWQILVLHLTDGTTVRVDRIAQLDLGGAVDRARALVDGTPP